MPDPEWGVKRTCPTTGKRFYDLNKDPIVSPYTGEIVVLEGAAPTDITKLRPGKATPKTAAKKAEPEDEDLVDDEDIVDADLDEDEDDAFEEDDEEADEATSPALSDEDTDDEPVEFSDEVLLEEDDEDDEAPLDEIGDVKSEK